MTTLTRQLLGVGAVVLGAVGGGIIGRAMARRKPVPVVEAQPAAPLPPATDEVIPEVVKDHLADVSAKIAAATAKAVEANMIARRAAAESTAADLAAEAGRMKEAERRNEEAEYLQKRADRLWSTYVDCIAQIDAARAAAAA